MDIARTISDAIRAVADHGALDPALATLGSGLRVNRAYLFHEHESARGAAVSQTNEWCAPGTPPEIDALQSNVIAEIGMERAMDTLHADQPFLVNASEMTSTEREHLGPQGIESMLCVPIRTHDRFWGLLGLDDCASERAWSDTSIDAARAVAASLGLYLQGVETQEHALHLREQLRTARRIGHDLNNALSILSGTNEARGSTGDELDVLEKRAISNATNLVLQLRGLPRQSFQAARADSIAGAALAATIGTNTRVSLHVDPALPRLNMDEGDLFRVIDNLVRNASAAMASAGAIEISARIAGPNSVRITVADSGPGMPEDALQKVYSHSGSSGLGLGICLGLVEANGGTLKVSTQPGKGTAVQITLPVLSEPSAAE